MKVIDIDHSLALETASLAFEGPVNRHNPLRYAWQPHQTYFQRRANASIEMLLLVVSPGLFGMVQTGMSLGGVIGRIIHLSPANPEANRNWKKRAEAQLRQLGTILEYS